MKILVVDTDRCGLPFTLRCIEAGHEVKLWMPKTRIGEGMVERPATWQPHMAWADLIFITDNSKVIEAMEPYHRRGFPIFGPNKAGSELELDREAGQDCFAEHGIEVLGYKTFNNYDEAIRYVEKEGKPFVSKPWGGNPNKDLSYVPKTAEDLICRLRKWKTELPKAEFLLQEMVEGAEMAIGGWFGPGGWSQWLCESWEEKRLMAGGLGPNTGEMGTVVRYVKKSRLFEEVLKPVTETLERIKYVGYIDVNCLVDSGGVPWPLEFTCRPGWPLFNLQMALHKGDPARWMSDLLSGKDSLVCSEDICVGVVMAMGDFPWDNDPPEHVDGWPIRGLSKSTYPHLALSSVRLGTAPIAWKGKIVEAQVPVSAGSYVLVATGTGPSVEAARDSVYGICDEIYWPPHRIYRIDIGCRLEKDLPKLQAHGFARGMKYA